MLVVLTKKGVLVSTMAALMMFTAACSSGSKQTETTSTNSSAEAPAASGEKVELRMMWWGSQVRHDATLKVIDLFQKKYPNIAIKPEYMSDGYFDKLNTVLAGGNAADLIQVGNNYPDYVKRGAFLDISPYYGKELKLDSFDQSIIDSGKMDNKLYAVSLGSNALGVIYNKTLLKGAGIEFPKDSWTWEEFAAYGKQVKDKTGAFGFVDGSDSTHMVNYFARQRGGAVYKDDGKIHFTKEQVVEYFTMWDQFRKAGIMPNGEQTAGYKESPDNSRFVEGKAAMKTIWSNQVTAYQKAMKDDIGIALLPSGGTTKGLWLQPSQFMSINAKSKHPKEAAMFIDFMVTDPEATLILGNERGVPGSSKVRNALKEKSNETDKKIYDYIDLAVKNSREMDRELPNIAEWQSELTVQSQKLAFGQTTVEKAAQAVVDSASKSAAKLK